MAFQDLWRNSACAHSWEWECPRFLKEYEENAEEHENTVDAHGHLEGSVALDYILGTINNCQNLIAMLDLKGSASLSIQGLVNILIEHNPTRI